jgi:antigen flippase
VAAMGILTSWWYARKIQVEKVSPVCVKCMCRNFRLLKLGFVFMASGLMTMGSYYLVRVIVLRKLGY